MNANAAVCDCEGLVALHHAVLHNDQHITEILLSDNAALTVSALLQYYYYLVM